MRNLPAFIANRLSGSDRASFSGPVVNIAITAIALGLSVMILSVAVLVGFQSEIREKVIGFSAHIRIDNFDSNASYESTPVSVNQTFYGQMQMVDGVRHTQSFALKAGIIKTEEQMQGVVLKGVDRQFEWSFFRENMVAGKVFGVGDSITSDSILLSKAIADKLRLQPGDAARMYFITGAEAQPRGRKFVVSGIYETGLEEFDLIYVLADIKHVQRLNGWGPDEVSGIEVFLDDFNELDPTAEEIYGLIPFNLNAETVRDTYPQIFDWLRLMDINVVIILLLMILVAGITIVSTLLILILERTSMIGTLKALGMNNLELRKLFLYFSARIIIKGMLIGNLAGLGLGLFQHYTRIIPLDQQSYYISYVPVSLQLWPILLINAGTFITAMLMILVPGYVIGRVSPVRAIRFD